VLRYLLGYTVRDITCIWASFYIEVINTAACKFTKIHLRHLACKFTKIHLRHLACKFTKIHLRHAQNLQYVPTLSYILDKVSLIPRPSITANAVEGLVKLLRRMTSGRRCI